MTTLFLILIAFVILTCIGLNNVSSRIGVPTLLAFLLLASREMDRLGLIPPSLSTTRSSRKRPAPSP